VAGAKPRLFDSRSPQVLPAAVPRKRRRHRAPLGHSAVFPAHEKSRSPRVWAAVPNRGNGGPRCRHVIGGGEVAALVKSPPRYNAGMEEKEEEIDSTWTSIPYPPWTGSHLPRLTRRLNRRGLRLHRLANRIMYVLVPLGLLIFLLFGIYMV
jgi:hypothetical protein